MAETGGKAGTGLLLVVLAVLYGCSDNTPAVRHIHTAFSETSGLTVSIDNGPTQRLLDRSQDARAVVSPDGRWILVEDKQFSNLTVIRAFVFSADGYREIELPALRVNWEALAAEVRLSIDDLLRPRVGIEGFVPGGESVLLHFQADAADRKHPGIDSVIAIPLTEPGA